MPSVVGALLGLGASSCTENGPGSLTIEVLLKPVHMAAGVGSDHVGAGAELEAPVFLVCAVSNGKVRVEGDDLPVPCVDCAGIS